jgi:hypothetical protein
MKSIAFLVVLIICLFIMVYLAIPDKQTHWGTKNCELSEISPDFTPQEKADCRIMRSKK